MNKGIALGTCVFGVGVIVACGGKLDDICGSYVDAFNHHAEQCSMPILDDATKASFVSLCDAIAKAPGTDHFQSAVDSCGDAMKSDKSCDSRDVPCIIRGTLPDGAACAVSAQCAGGICNSTSLEPNPNSEINCGTCASYAEVGESCDHTQCNPMTGSCSGITQGVCQAYAKEGESCDGPSAGSCGPSLFCSFEGNVCAKLPTKGEGCPESPCEDPYRCIQGACTDGVGEGGACPTGLECAPGLDCDFNAKTCTKPASDGAPAKKAGEACVVGHGDCEAFSLVCIGGTCQPPDYTVCK